MPLLLSSVAACLERKGKRTLNRSLSRIFLENTADVCISQISL